MCVSAAGVVFVCYLGVFATFNVVFRLFSERTTILQILVKSCQSPKSLSSKMSLQNFAKIVFQKQHNKPSCETVAGFLWLFVDVPGGPLTNRIRNQAKNKEAEVGWG